MFHLLVFLSLCAAGLFSLMALLTLQSLTQVLPMISISLDLISVTLCCMILILLLLLISILRQLLAIARSPELTVQLVSQLMITETLGLMILTPLSIFILTR